MSAFIPSSAFGQGTDPDHPKLKQRPASPDEQRARWEVRAAQWRARELAEYVWGSVSVTGLTGIRSAGPMRGLLRLDVPFGDLDAHLEREARFLDAVARDPLLADVPLVYVIGPHAD
jgi:hypothetical protein